MSNVSRRGFLRSLPITALASVVPRPSAQQQHAGHGGADADGISAALRRPVAALRGFDPAGFVGRFDSGRETPLPGGRTLREYVLRARDVDLEVAPGVIFRAWAFNGSVPGPTLRCREGDVLRVRFENRSLAEHTIHFHGIRPPGMDGVLPLVPPGEDFTYEFTAEPAGLHLYHCHVPPVHLHMNRGLFGALIIDPVEPRSPARELVMVLHGWDTNFDGRNELYAVNGPANFYRDNPIPLGLHEAIRVYLVNVLEFDPINSFHLHANMFRLLRTGIGTAPDSVTDIVTLGQAERCILEFSYRYPGSYMFHAHQSALAEAGWMGHFLVS